jgi:hypothetical protein
MDWIMREVLPRAKKFRERVAASDGLPEMFIMAGGRYDG